MIQIIKLKENWFVRLPYPMPERDIFWTLARYRFDPFIAPTLLGLSLGGGIAGAMATRREGKEAEKLGEARAQILQQQGADVRAESVEQAKILEEKRRRLVAEQKGAFAAGNVRLNVGAPLAFEAQTNADFAKEKGYVLETARRERQGLESRAAYERAYGKSLRKQSKWAALSQLLGTGAQAGYRGWQMGLFSPKKKSPKLTTSGTHIKGMPSGYMGMDW